MNWLSAFGPWGRGQFDLGLLKVGSMCNITHARMLTGESTTRGAQCVLLHPCRSNCKTNVMRGDIYLTLPLARKQPQPGVVFIVIIQNLF